MSENDTNIKQLEVFLGEKKVGTLTRTPEGRIAFSYDEHWLSRGFSISPFSLPLQDTLFTAPQDPHEGLFGVFGDTLPDGWGLLLLERELHARGLDPNVMDALDRLALLDDSSLGALTYKPSSAFTTQLRGNDFDALSQSANEILVEKDSDNLDVLFAMGGSSGGARPKVHATMDGESWIVKFPTKLEGPNAGKDEYEIAQLAQSCGIVMSETRLLPSKVCSGYFATKRFDRHGDQRVHMLSAAGLLEISHRDFNLTYEALFQALTQLGAGHTDLEELYRRMAFNVAIGNRDDHAKNFSFLYDADKRWRLSPAYDLTRNSGVMGERATTINGKGKNISVLDMVTVAEETGLNTSWAEKTAREIMRKREQ